MTNGADAILQSRRYSLLPDRTTRLSPSPDSPLVGQFSCRFQFQATLARVSRLQVARIPPCVRPFAPPPICATQSGWVSLPDIIHAGIARGLDYARPLAREREIAMPPLHGIVQSKPSGSLTATATALIDALTTWDEAAAADRNRYQPPLSASELTVLQRLDSQTDKAIARDLNLTYDGVRYRITGRGAAGILPNDGGATPFHL